MLKRFKQIVVDSVECWYFATAIILVLIELRKSLQDFIDKPKYEVEPYYRGYEAVVVATLGEPFFLMTIVFLARFLIQKRWAEFGAIIMYVVAAFYWLGTRAIRASPETQLICEVIAQTLCILLNAVVLGRALIRVFTQIRLQMAPSSRISDPNQKNKDQNL